MLKALLVRLLRSVAEPPFTLTSLSPFRLQCDAFLDVQVLVVGGVGLLQAFHGVNGRKFCDCAASTQRDR